MRRPADATSLTGRRRTALPFAGPSGSWRPIAHRHLDEVPGMDIGKADRGGPRVPQAGAQDAAVGQAGEPLTGLPRAADQVRLAVAVQVAQAYVRPGERRVPQVPQAGVQVLAVGQAGEPLARLPSPADQVGL